MTPIATYREKLFDGKRTFDLLADRVIIKGKKSFGAEFETTLLLQTLQPVVNKARIRPKGFGQGIGLAVVAISLIQSGVLNPLAYFGTLAIVMAISGVLLSLATARKVDWVYINSRAGVLALAIARADSAKAAFEPFVQLLIQQIQIAEESAGDFDSEQVG